MKVLALALALGFTAAPVMAAAKTPVSKGHHAAKHSKVKTKSHVKRANKASHLKSANRNRVN
jgi:hypothetical protein